MTSDGEKHSKRAGEPDPGLDPEPYESSRPSQEAVQRGGAEERLLASVGEDPTGDDVEPVDQPDQPDTDPPHAAPAPPVPGTRT
jgi:hypothetical protein